MTDYFSIINQLIIAIENIQNELGPTPGGVYANSRVRLDILESRINNSEIPSPTVEDPFIIGNNFVGNV